MMEIRWVIENSPKGREDWHPYNGQSYAGWFYANGVTDGPTDGLFEEFGTYVQELPHLDWRIIEERRSFTRTPLRTSHSTNEPDVQPAE